MKKYLYRSFTDTRVSPAFTLVEMLVVIAIITVMLTVGTLGLKNLSKAKGVSAGLPTAEAVFAEARDIAIGKATKTRVLIHAKNDHTDEIHRERFLRYMTVQHWDDNGTPNNQTDDAWVISSRASMLPEGVYFVESLSENNAPALPQVDVDLPGVNTSSKSNTTCFYYEFNAEGLITNPAITGNSVPRFVIRAGSLPPGESEPLATGTAKRNIGGFVIWRTGRTSLFRHPDQIDP